VLGLGFKEKNAFQALNFSGSFLQKNYRNQPEGWLNILMRWKAQAQATHFELFMLPHFQK
jgi:hypothetical protein